MTQTDQRPARNDQAQAGHQTKGFSQMKLRNLFRRRQPVTPTHVVQRVHPTMLATSPGATLSPAQLLAHQERMDALALPLLPTDTGLLADAISDGDHPALRDEVHVTASGALIHHDLSGGAR